MNLLAIVGSPRKGQATDTLVDKAIQGVETGHPDAAVTKVNLADLHILHCKNCLTCRDADTDAPFSPCVIKDGMTLLYQEILKADALILGTPVHSGYPTALMMMFLERITWTFAKPEKRYLTIKGCPTPRSDKQRKAIIIVTSGIIPPLYRRFCDWATACIRGVVKDSLNAKTVGDLYAGDIEHRGAVTYFDRAFDLGQKLRQ